MNTPNHESTERDRIYDEMVAYRAKLVADFEVIERQHTKNLADLDAVIATLDLRRTPQVGVDRKQCGNCGGWLVPGPGGWVHDRDGQMACKPGHSGPVASPLAQTTAFPAVAPNLPKWAGRQLGEQVRLIAHDGEEARGSISAMTDQKITVMVGNVPYTIDDSDLASIEPYPPVVLDPDCRGRKHASCMGEPCECFCHVYAYLLGQHIGVVLADGSAEIWGDLEGVDGQGIAVRDGRGITNTFQRSAIGQVLLDDGQKAAPYGKPADLDTPTTTPAQDGSRADG